MRRLLIIDDDALVRMFIRQILPWEAEGYQVVGDARDGEEGLSMFEEYKPDLIIADVSMPVMNGIEFLKVIKEKGYTGGIIMLSCHEDFEYVKTAMSLGADEYILKNHLNSKHLKEVIRAVEENADKRRLDKNQQLEIEQYAKKGIAETRKEVLQQLLESGGYTREEEERLFDKAQLKGHFRNCGVILAQLPINHHVKKDAFYELCGQIATNNGAEHIIFRDRVSAFILDLTQYPSSRKQNEMILSLQKVITSYTWEYLSIKISTGSSEICNGVGAIARGVRQAQKALMLSFYEQGSWGYEESLKMSDKCGKKAEALSSQLQYLIESGDESELKKTCDESLQEFEEIKAVPSVIRDWLKRLDMTVGIIRQDSEYIHIETLRQLMDYMNEYVIKLFELHESKIPKDVSVSVKEAVRYIHEHFHEACSLGEVAEHVSLTSSYLSALFKKEMGTGFASYLTEIRINQAKLMLKREDTETIKSISEQAGFSDYQHFCKVFKKKTGLSPAVYRKEKQV